MKLFAKKSLGQHFLNSPTVLAKIIAASHILPTEIILEIGPGTGILTEALLKTGAKVIAIEKDQRALEGLAEKFQSEIAAGKLVLQYADILETDRASFGLKNGEYALVANIPYYITGAILESFLEYEPRPNRMVLLVQKEVAQRIIAANSKESILSMSVKAFGIPKIIDTVPRGAFVPPPNVDSAILAIESVSDRRFSEKNLNIRRFFDVVKAGFAHKRKFAKSNLQAVMEKGEIDATWNKNTLNEKIRAEDMTLEQWVGIIG
jgi:16S rRNA (adenine1518-N6/adenine1519-N6)-dimethyltransferase